MIIADKITKEELEKLFDNSFSTVLKFVVDIEREILSAGCEYYIDCVQELIANGSNMGNVWGANLYRKDLSIDFVSLINIRPAENNRSMEILDENIKQKVENIAKKLLCN